MNKIGVIGAGAWGTTLSILLAQNGHEVVLWSFEKEIIPDMLEYRENRKYLPGFQLSSKIEITTDDAKLENSDCYFFVVPTQFLRMTAKRFSKIIGKGKIIVSAGKGVEKETLKLPLNILEDEIKECDYCVLSGPNLSSEIAKGLPAAATVASKNLDAAKTIQAIIMHDRFRVYTNVDVIGVQLGGALKNVIAIAAGICDGLKLGDNAKSAMIVRGIAEISRIGQAMGARPETFAGLSGIGDLITTCESKLSRNHFVGEEIAAGKKLHDIQKEMKDIAEGVPTTAAAKELGKKLKVSMPITEEVHKVLFEGKDPYAAVSALMTRSATSE
ncbi:MAG: NAD(P)H-dependent glycerol-3-phosphate dehydrogenase [Candidatus Margulisiibacteriota bacterium]